MEPSSANFWRRQAAGTALRHNFARALEVFLPACLAVSAVFACALLIVREKGGEDRIAWQVYAVGLVTCMAFAFLRVRRHFFNVHDAFVRLDWHLGLHNRLSSAHDGVGAFPEPQPVSDGYSLRWRKIALSLAGAAVLIGGAAFIPVAKLHGSFTPTAVPVAWQQTAAWVDALKKTDTVEDPALEDLRERLEQLHKQSPEDWFSQSSLEAGDNLQEQTADAMRALQRDVRSALGNLEAMQRFTDDTPAGQMKEAREGLQSALKGLEMGNLPLDRDLLKSLKQATAADLKSLSPEQMKELQRRLGSCDKVCQGCLRSGETEGKIVDGKSGSTGTKGQPGGKGGGKSSAELNLNDEAKNLGSTKTDAISNPNLDRVVPGDLLGVSTGEHPVDPEKNDGAMAGGAVASNGEGGDTVWRNDLTPQEHAVLKKFFK